MRPLLQKEKDDLFAAAAKLGAKVAVGDECVYWLGRNRTGMPIHTRGRRNPKWLDSRVCRPRDFDKALRIWETLGRDAG